MQKTAGKPRLGTKGLSIEDIRRLLNSARVRRMNKHSDNPQGPCVYCGKQSEGRYAIHRTNEMSGVELPLCNEHGAHPTPTCEEIWDVIKAKGL